MIRALEMSFTSDLQSRLVKWTCAGKIELICGRLLPYSIETKIRIINGLKNIT